MGNSEREQADSQENLPEGQGSQTNITGPVGSVGNQGTLGNAAGQARDQITASDNATINIYNNSPVAERAAQQGIEGVPPHNLPQMAVPEGQFCGRDRALEEVRAQLDAAGRLAVCAIAGMGGVGKTELALQFAWRNFARYPGGVCWLQAQQEIGTQVVAFVREALQLPVPEGLDEAGRLRFCWRNWRGGKALIAFDDVLDYDEIAPALPPEGGQFEVLLTSRQKPGPKFKRLDLDVLSPEAALELLEQLAGQERVTAEPEAAAHLCKWLGYLPLGVELAGRYLYWHEDLTVAGLQELLEQDGLAADILEQVEPEMTATRGVAKAFELSWEQLSEDGRELAAYLSLFAAAPIPWELTGVEDGEEVRDRELVRGHLLQRIGTGRYRLHPLVRQFLQVKRQGLPRAAELEAAFCKGMVAIARQIPQAVTLEIVAAVREAIPHLQEAAEQHLAAVTDEGVLGLFAGLDKYYDGQGLHGQALRWSEGCREAIAKRLGQDHPNYATSLNNLAALYRAQGKYDQALPLYEEALALIGRVLGQDHPNYASSLNNLAALYRAQGKYDQALPLYEEALALTGRVLGQEHPDYASSLNNLAALYESQGKYDQALPLLEEALALIGRVLGQEHPDYASSLNNLAALYESQGKYDQALPLYKEALALRHRVLGQDHPNYAQSLNNLALLYESQGKYDQALPLYEEALALIGRVLGQDHPNYAQSLNNLALLYKSQGKYDQALPLYEEALALIGRVLGQDHPDYALSLNNLAVFHANRGDFAAALPLLQQAISIWRARLGDEHPDTQSSIQSLQVLQQMIEKSQSRTSTAQPPNPIARWWQRLRGQG